MSLTYRDSGVDIEGGNSFVNRISPIVKKTFSQRVITGIGGFGALFDGSFPEMKEPVLVSGTDGVGTKLKIAQMMGIHNTIGIDAVAMCVNDIVTSGARPLFFLDYISCGKLSEDTMTDIVSGIAEGCHRSECSLIGGETAEHPDVMDAKDYDIAGFSVGVVDKPKIINGSKIKEGDIVIGLPSSGVHSNGFSLVRKLFLSMKQYSLDAPFESLGSTLGEALLTPTEIYIKQIFAALDGGIDIKGLVHVTGGGFYENIPRILPDTCGVTIKRDSYPSLPIFEMIQKEGAIDNREMFTTFNMGIGMILFIDKAGADSLLSLFKEKSYEAFPIGSVTSRGSDAVVIV